MNSRPRSPLTQAHIANIRALPGEREIDMRATVERTACYFDANTDDESYEAVDTHAATEGIVVSLAIGILLWAFIGLGAGWL